MEKKGKMYIQVDKEDENGVKPNWYLTHNYEYYKADFNQDLKIIAYDLARLVEILEAPNFEATVLRLHKNLN